MPVWIEKPTEKIEPEKTTFIIQFKDGNAADHVRKSLKLLRAELYLFLKWIKKIHIIDENSGEKTTLENAPKEGEITVLKHGDQTYRFKFFRKEVTVPDLTKQDRLTQEYRANVIGREIAIAFAVDAKGNLTRLLRQRCMAEFIHSFRWPNRKRREVSDSGGFSG